MTDKPDGRTVPTQFRLDEEDKRRLDAIQEHFGFWSRTDAVRYAMDVVYREIAGKPPQKKIREKYVRDS